MLSGIWAKDFSRNRFINKYEKNAIATIGKRLTAKKYFNKRDFIFEPSVKARRSCRSFSKTAGENESENDKRDKIYRKQRVKRERVACRFNRKTFPKIRRLQNDQHRQQNKNKTAEKPRRRAFFYLNFFFARHFVSLAYCQGVLRKSGKAKIC